MDVGGKVLVGADQQPFDGGPGEEAAVLRGAGARLSYGLVIF